MTNFKSFVLFAAGAFAFPQGAPLASRQVPGTGPGLSKTFNPKTQLIDVHGKHAFVPPRAGDERGPCPGLNALANHGYLPHNGIGTVAQFALATNQVWGFAYDVALSFATYGAMSAGNGLEWSMGGPPPASLSDPELLSRPVGISFTHNSYEGDASATRQDFYTSGKAYALDINYFKELYDTLPATDYKTLAAHRNKRVQDSIASNPYYFNGPFTGVAIAAGANAFIFRMAANHSAEYPQGYLDKATFASLWSVKDEGGKLTWIPGHDRIPEDWYRRPHDDEYSIAFAAQDIATNILLHPESAKVGGNTGTTNSFVGVDITNLTGGVYTAQNLAKGNNAACFAYQAGALLAPDVLGKVFFDITGPLAKLNKVWNKMLAPLNCPQLQTLDTEYLNQYPGYRNSNAHQ